MNTPWGPSQSHKYIAPGIIAVSTASHGGYYIWPHTLTKMPEALRAIRSPYAPEGWYEEDCDWVIVALAFPEHFPRETLEVAISMARSFARDGYLDPVGAWIDTDDPRAKQVHYIASLDEISRERYLAALARHDGQPVYGPLADHKTHDRTRCEGGSA